MNDTSVQDEETRLKRQGPETAIHLALEGKWEEAVVLNRRILEVNENDVDAHNRLGKSLLELGRFREAREEYQRALHLDPVNTIAKRNLDRLATVKDDDEPRREASKVAEDLFIEEVGKSGTTVLQEVPADTLAKMVSGDEVYLKADESVLRVENIQGDQLGIVEAKLGLRLLRMMQGGNRYAAAVKSVTDRAELIIKETFRDPSQTRLSFPAVGGEGVRPYTRETLLRYDIDDEDDDVDEERDADDWGETEVEAGDGTVSLSTYKEAMDSGDDEEEEE